MFEMVWQDLKYAARALRRTPGFTITVVLTLAIGIAGNAAIFSIADALLLRQRPGISDPARLVAIGRTDRERSFDTFSYPNYVDLRDRATVFETLAAYREGESFGLGITPAAVRVFGGQVSANYFDVLRVPMLRGRGFFPDEERIADPAAVTVISARLWQDRFDSDPGVVGRALHLNGRPFTIVGVAGGNFTGHSIVSEDLWVPLTTYPEGGDLSRLTRRGGLWLQGIGRLKPGTTLEQARGQVHTIGVALEREFPEANRGRGLTVEPFAAVPQPARPAAMGFLALLFALVGLILSIACLNVGGMLLARSVGREREIGVRLALGAARQGIVRLLVTEVMLLAMMGAVLGTALASTLVRLLLRLAPVVQVDLTLDFRTDWRVIGFSIAVAFGAGLLCALVPSLQASRLRLVNTLTRETGTRRRFGARQAFVVAQLAFSILLVVCALLLGRSLDNAYRIDPGFRTEGVEVAGIDLRLGGYEGERAAGFARTLVSRLEELPAIEAAASARVVPLTMEGFSGGRLWHPGDPRDDDHAIPVDWNIVTPGYFQTLEIPLLRGRRFSAADASGSSNIAIVNETLARRAWPGEDPVGRTILYGVSGRPLQIVGVARDAKYRTLGEPPRPFLYVPLAQHYEPQLWLMIRSRYGSAIPALRELVRELDPNLPLVTTAALADMTAIGLLPNRAAMWVATSVGLVGLLLAAIGVYGITAYDVSRRTREIGVRVALGALRHQVMTLVVRRAMLLAAAGAALGMGLAAIAGRFLTALLYGVEPLDPVSFAAGAVLLATCALAASVAPALRAASSDPVTALRAE